MDRSMALLDLSANKLTITRYIPGCTLSYLVVPCHTGLCLVILEHVRTVCFTPQAMPRQPLALIHV